jgi:hypothetical protein
MKTKNLIWAAVLFLLPAVSFAQTSARDADIDAKMNAGAMLGIAPPTGAQSVPASTPNGQKFQDPYLPAVVQGGNVVLGQTDGKGRVYQVKGKVYLAKKGSPEEVRLKKGAILEAGDTITTEAKSSVSIAFDESYKNAVQITENSKAILEGVEPTNIRIINGSIFNAVDGLPKGSSWKVTTPAAVAAVRGTLYIVRFIAANGQFFAATVNVPDDGKTSAIDIQEISGSDSADVPEGKEITLNQGQEPDQSLVKDLDPSALQEIMDFFKNLVDLRGSEGGQAPPTSGEYTAPGALDPAGPGVMGWSEDRLDIEDTGVITEPTVPEVFEESSSYGYGDYYQPPIENNCEGPCYE